MNQLNSSCVLSGKKTVLIPAVLLAAFLVKNYYSNADSGSLFWILGPTAFLVELFSGIPFNNEPGIGWVNLAYDVVIVPSCSGVNFLIILFCMSSFRIIFSRLSMHCILKAVVLAAVAAYFITLSVNGLRIWLSIVLYRADVYSGWLTPEVVHRIAGVSVYYLFLCFYYQLVSFILRKVEIKKQLAESVFSTIGQMLLPVVPLCWYLLFSLGVPFVNNAYGVNPERFINHAVTVAGTSVLLTVGLLALAAGYQYVARFYRKRAAR